eukprot:NODE_13181_length_1180_cov_4.756885.p1 GENE.NODE_13181_length_1180_cov_4.756885~~NODE_13181_length_1180_cov_4.756885.p1  ORF type:complete len:214 (+),score=43.35 NODE_13181_length_1180_cov_4.756885:500-1141(+)
MFHAHLRVRAPVKVNVMAEVAACANSDNVSRAHIEHELPPGMAVTLMLACSPHTLGEFGDPLSPCRVPTFTLRLWTSAPLARQPVLVLPRWQVTLPQPCAGVAAGGGAAAARACRGKGAGGDDASGSELSELLAEKIRSSVQDTSWAFCSKLRARLDSELNKFSEQKQLILGATAANRTPSTAVTSPTSSCGLPPRGAHELKRRSVCTRAQCV